MNQNDNGDEPPTIPPRRMPSFPEAEPAPRVAISDLPEERRSNPDLLGHAPPWLADILRRLDEAKVAEKERADQQHRAASRMSAAFLKTEATAELTRQEVLGCRADLREIGRHLAEMELRIEMKMQGLEERFEERFASMEARVAALEAAKQSG